MADGDYAGESEKFLYYEKGGGFLGFLKSSGPPFGWCGMFLQTKASEMAHLAWECYDADATARELWYASRHSWRPYAPLHCPRLEPFPHPEDPSLAIRGFQGLFELYVRRGYEWATACGWEGSLDEFHRMVKDAGKHLGRSRNEEAERYANRIR